MPSLLPSTHANKVHGHYYQRYLMCLAEHLSGRGAVSCAFDLIGSCGDQWGGQRDCAQPPCLEHLGHIAVFQFRGKGGALVLGQGSTYPTQGTRHADHRVMVGGIGWLSTHIATVQLNWPAWEANAATGVRLQLRLYEDQVRRAVVLVHVRPWVCVKLSSPERWNFRGTLAVVSTLNCADT